MILYPIYIYIYSLLCIFHIRSKEYFHYVPAEGLGGACEGFSDPYYAELSMQMSFISVIYLNLIK